MWNLNTKMKNRSKRKAIAFLLMFYSILHYLLFGFEFWVILFIIMGCCILVSVLKKKEDAKKPKNTMGSDLHS